jgi:isochorismate hydrolase
MTLEEQPMSDTAPALSIDARRTALLVQDLQNDVVSPGGAFEDSGVILSRQQWPTR